MTYKTPGGVFFRLVWLVSCREWDGACISPPLHHTGKADPTDRAYLTLKWRKPRPKQTNFFTLDATVTDAQELQNFSQNFLVTKNFFTVHISGASWMLKLFRSSRTNRLRTNTFQCSGWTGTPALLRFARAPCTGYRRAPGLGSALQTSQSNYKVKSFLLIFGARVVDRRTGSTRVFHRRTGSKHGFYSQVSDRQPGLWHGCFIEAQLTHRYRIESFTIDQLVQQRCSYEITMVSQNFIVNFVNPFQ